LIDFLYRQGIDLGFLDFAVFNHTHDIGFDKSAPVRQLEHASQGNQEVIESFIRAVQI
jgi:hypothetical protein